MHPRLIALSVVLATSLATASDDHKPTVDPHRVLVGVNYFAGWWSELPNKWHGHGWRADEPDWRPTHPDRDPLAGPYNVQAAVDREIVMAAEHAVDFFAILWYYPVPGAVPHEANAQRLNRGLDCFVRSPEAHRLGFIIEYCNHDLFAATTDQQWRACIDTWLAAWRHPSALQVGKRRVFKIHDAAGFYRQNGSDLGRAEARLRQLREAARQAGLGELLIGGGIMSRSAIAPKSTVARLFDFTSTYMSIPPTDICDEDQPYRLLADEAREARARHASDPIPWVPYLAAGWNPRPWTHAKADPNHRRFFTFPTRSEWTAELKSIRDDFEKYPQLGLPLPGGGRQRVFTIYAWNEYGEGGIVAPTRGDGAMKLEAIREVFGPGK